MRVNPTIVEMLNPQQGGLERALTYNTQVGLILQLSFYCKAIELVLNSNPTLV